MAEEDGPAQARSVPRRVDLLVRLPDWLRVVAFP